ncbi:hypothetical protein ABOM_004336 [Aspergillus bombycis]|uniref:Auxiliary Activity family 9 catalytic domain-containing protein n=1 Tax=Aspergillus bombycis TaxID=109264 RepID=A0A1F8A8H0_9EURO|nr:hypothetical protein ABOM_004336 [Aspergillus bombycis]OGM47655.1 hypothetical protein ABOM_004336 [Aspergillus bombycis]
MSIARLVSLSLASAAVVAGHGYVTGIVVDDNQYYGGYLMTQYPYTDTPPGVVAWSESATDLGFVNGTGYTGGDIICHRDAENAALSATVTAGSTVQFQWDDWDESHHGPVIEYLARCDGDRSVVDKYSLKWFKISEKGLIDAIGNTGQGFWASDELIANNYSWSTTIPSSISAGNYVLRHEIIALHSASEANGAQNYPQCFNLRITSDGSDNPAGIPGTELYSATDPGILFNIWETMDSYPIPGPALYPNGSSGSTQPPSSTAVTTNSALTSSRIVTVATAPPSIMTPTSAPQTVFDPTTTPTAGPSKNPNNPSLFNHSTSAPKPDSRNAGRFLHYLQKMFSSLVSHKAHPRSLKITK